MNKFNTESNNMNQIITNTAISENKLHFAQQIIEQMFDELYSHIAYGSGPFLAAIYDENRKLIAKCSNSVVNDCCSNSHAEVNTIKMAEAKLGTYDLSKYNLSLYITAEPCMMCLGAILWSGIKEVYFGVPTKYVEQITGYDEGLKPDWLAEFAKRNIKVYGNIAAEKGKDVLKKYVENGNKIYKPKR